MDNQGEKKYLSVGEIAKKVGVETHTIRFWSEEFADNIKLVTGKGGRRYYEHSNVDIFQLINDLIHKQGFKIRAIKENKLLNKPATQDSIKQKISDVNVVLQKSLEKLILIENKLKELV